MTIPAPAYTDSVGLIPFLPSERADTAAAARQASASGDKKQLSAFAEGNDSPSFWDVLDVINPLQHIPVVNNLYREATGDQIGVAARVAGGTLFGGPVGLVVSLIDCAVEQETGENMGGHALAMLRDTPAADSNNAVAQAETAPQAATNDSSKAVAMDDSSKAPVVNNGSKAAAPTNTPIDPAKSAAPSASFAVSLPDMENITPSQPQSLPKTAFSLDGSVVNLATAAPAAAQIQSPYTPKANPAVTAAANAPITFDSIPTNTAVYPAVNPAAIPVSAPAPQAIANSAAMVQAQALTKPQRVMPVPARKPIVAGNGPAPISVPISNGSSRSNVPVTGRDPVAARTANVTNELAVQRALAQQGLASNQHPMLPSVDGSTKVNSGSADWFSSAFNQAMDKYQKSASLTQQSATQTINSDLY